MELTKEEKLQVTKTFYKIMLASDRAAEQFYARLFEIAPEVRPLFGDIDMLEQRKKLMDMIALVVHSLDKFDKVTTALQGLGKRHVTYGVSQDHYALMGQALFWMLEQELGADWTPEVASAWTKTYQHMVAVSTAGVYGDS
jgi:hemoglobin-like flavoprotein